MISARRPSISPETTRKPASNPGDPGMNGENRGSAAGATFVTNEVHAPVALSTSSEFSLPEHGERRSSQRSTSTTDTGITEDEESDTHSVHSRRDSLEGSAPLKSREIFDGGGGDGGERQGVSGEPESGHKRTLDDKTNAAGMMLRKACDLCTKRKRKCDGQHPCSHCLETGMRSQCVYSPRLKSGRKKKVRVDGVLYEEGTAPPADGSGGLALVANNRNWQAGYSAVDPSAGRFSPSGAVGLAGHVENFFLATYLRDFNRIVPLTTESSVTEGMLEVLSSTISSRGLSQTSPIPQPESRRQAKLAVFWGVVAMGSRILKAEDEATARYLTLMRAALRECFDSNDKEVVQAYLLLSTVETMRGHEEVGKRYLDHAHTMHNSNAMGPEGNLLRGRPEQEESLDLVFQIYGQPDGCVGQMNAMDSTAVDQMIAQAMSPPSESQSGPLKALKYLSTACGLSSEVFDPTNKCVTVKQYLGEMDSALKGADTLFKHTDLSECITGVVMVKIWGGVTVLMQSWGKQQEKEMGLAQVEEGVGYALTRPGLMTFPMWWHALHCAAIVLAHFGHHDTYMRLRATFNKNTFRGTEMPPIESYSPGAICPQLGGSCSKLAYWLQVRGTMCSAAGWKPQFAETKCTEAGENAAYAAAISHKFASAMAEAAAGGGNAAGTGGDHPVQGEPERKTAEYPADASHPGGAGHVIAKSLAMLSRQRTTIGEEVLQREPSREQSLMRASLDAGLNQLGGELADLGGLETLSSGELDDIDLGVEFDLSHFKDMEPEVAEGPNSADGGGTGSGGPAFVQEGGSLSREISNIFTGGGALSREVSFASKAGSQVQGGDELTYQSSLDINTIMQMASSDEELKQQEGQPEDAMDAALSFGEGPAKELFGVELNAL